MRREADGDRAPRGPGEFLIELRHMTVAADAIGMESFRDLREQHLFFHRPPRAGHARFGIDHDLVGIDRLRAQERDERKLRASRVATGIGDQPRARDLVPVDFGQAIDRLLLQFRGMMLAAVPARVGGGLAEAKVRGEINHLGVRSLDEQVFDHRLRGRVPQRAESEIYRGVLPVDAVDRYELPQRVGRKLREDLTHVLPGAALGGKERDLDPWMADEEPQQLRTGIAGRAEHADLSLVSHGSSPSHEFAHSYAKCGRNATIRAAIACMDGLPWSRSARTTAT